MTELRGHPHPGQRYKHGWIPIGVTADKLKSHTAALKRFGDSLRESVGKVETTVDWKGAHFTAHVKGRPVTVDVTPLDAASLALAFVPGGELVAASRAAIIANRVRKALGAAKAVETVAHSVRSSDVRHRELALLGIVEARGHPHPGQKFHHGWVPVSVEAVAEILTPDEAARDYGDELDRVEFPNGVAVVARSEGMLTVQSEGGDTATIHAAPSPAEADGWADYIDEGLDLEAGEQTTEDGIMVARTDSGLSIRFPEGDEPSDNPDDHDGFDLTDDEATDFAQALRDMGYITDDHASVPEDTGTEEPPGDETPIPDDLLIRHRSLMLLGVEVRAVDPKHPHYGKGVAGGKGGEFRPLKDIIMDALTGWGGEGDPLAEYSQPQLKKVATDLGLNPPKGMRLVPLKGLILSHARERNGLPDVPFVPAPTKPRKAKVDDGLDDMPEDRLRRYASEWDVKPEGKSRAQITAALRRKGAASPEKTRERAAAGGGGPLADRDTPYLTSFYERAGYTEREKEIDRRIRDAFQRLQYRTDLPENADWVSWTGLTAHAAARGIGGRVNFADLRDELHDIPRAELDDVLKKMGRTARAEADAGRTPSTIVMHGEEAQDALTPRDRAASLEYGNRPHHWLKISDNAFLAPASPAAKKAAVAKAAPSKRTPRAPKETPAETVAKLEKATSRDQAREILAGKTTADLKAVAAEMGAGHITGTKPRMVEQLAELTGGAKAVAAAHSGVGDPGFRRYGDLPSTKALADGRSIHDFTAGLGMTADDSGPSLRFEGDLKNLPAIEVANRIDGWLGGPDGPAALARRVKAGEDVPGYSTPGHSPAQREASVAKLEAQAERWAEVSRRLHASPSPSSAVAKATVGKAGKKAAPKSLMAQMSPEHRKLAREHGLPDDHPLTKIAEQLGNGTEEDDRALLESLHPDDVKQIAQEVGATFPVGMKPDERAESLARQVHAFGGGNFHTGLSAPASPKSSTPNIRELADAGPSPAVAKVAAAKKAAPRAAKAPAAVPNAVAGVLIDPEAPDYDRLVALRDARTTADLRRIAQEYGVRVPSYVKTKEGIREHLVRELKYNPGEDIDAYKARTGGGVGPKARP